MKIAQKFSDGDAPVNIVAVMMLGNLREYFMDTRKKQPMWKFETDLFYFIILEKGKGRGGGDHVQCHVMTGSNLDHLQIRIDEYDQDKFGEYAFWLGKVNVSAKQETDDHYELEGLIDVFLEGGKNANVSITTPFYITIGNP